MYSYYILTYRGEAIEDSVDRLLRCGYDAIELPGEPDEYSSDRIRTAIRRSGLRVSAICGRYRGSRDLSASDPDVRRQTVNYGKATIDLGSAYGAGVVVVAATRAFRVKAETSAEDEWDWAAEGIREIGEYGLRRGVRVAIEPWNRYETYMLNTVADALKMSKQVDLSNVGVLADTFHMAIEEADLASALRSTGDKLYHVHIADSNRRAPGYGHTNFREILGTLAELRYKGFLTLELLPPPHVFEQGAPREFFDEYTEEGIKYLKRIEDES